jgi:DNA glycosylase AlkZ-like
MIDHIAERRLRNQRIVGTAHRRPEDVVSWLGAVQAQEYPAARWGLALRMKGRTTDAEIARAIDEGRILRTHVMRPTWHFVTPQDIRWMLELTGPRVRQRMAHYGRQAGLDASTVTRALGIFERALGGGHHLTRGELGQHLARAGVPMKGVPLALVTMYAELDGLICSGAYRGKQLTYALLAERVPAARVFSRDEALAELTRRFFSSHGPATIRDFVWWSGLTTADARRGLEMNRARHEILDGLTYTSVDRAPRVSARSARVHMLPIYDEYLVAYRDRAAVPHSASTLRTKTSHPVTFQHALVAGGQVAGTWRVQAGPDGVRLEVALLRRLKPAEREDMADAAGRYGRFLGIPASVTVR